MRHPKRAFFSLVVGSTLLWTGIILLASCGFDHRVIPEPEETSDEPVLLDEKPDCPGGTHNHIVGIYCYCDTGYDWCVPDLNDASCCPK